MRREGGGLLYIGKARSLQRRVSSYFRPRARHPEHILEMLTQARDLEVCETETALAAALQEADEIGRLSPPYNRALRTEKKSLVFISPDFARTAAEPGDDCRIGPLPGERIAAGLCALSRIWRGLSFQPSPGAADVATAFDLVPECLPDEVLLREGIDTFLRRHGTTFPGNSAPRSMMKVARVLWKERMAADGDAPLENESEKEPVASFRAKPEWTPERVAGRLEGILCHGGRMIRRSRWLAILSESSLAWGPRAGDPSLRNLVVFHRGEVRLSATLVQGQPLPVPPGPSGPAWLRWGGLDLSAYQRLRVATTEIRRLLAEDRDPVLQVTDRIALGPGQLKRMLFWV
jgi:hypothetical protein